MKNIELVPYYNLRNTASRTQKSDEKRYENMLRLTPKAFANTKEITVKQIKCA
jgi:hypothetical protein